jgi:hypothetical protein
MKMSNEQIKKDFARFLETGCDYSNEMFRRDQKVIRRAEFISDLMIFTAGLLAGVILYTLFGV